MKTLKASILTAVLFLTLQGCNTLYNTKTIDIEILVPGKARIPNDYKKMAVQYNNSNVSWNPDFAGFSEDTTTLIDYSNSDSIASFIYYNTFIDHVSQQNFFDTIIKRNHHINPENGLYSKQKIQQIANSTGADLLLSLDFFAVKDAIITPQYMENDTNALLWHPVHNPHTASETVHISANWNVYDLKKIEFARTIKIPDSEKWIVQAYSLKEAKRALPPRNVAVNSAAEMAGGRFAEFLVPHWINVKRMYYQSRQTELRKTNNLIKQNQWIEIAEIWKRNVNNKNKIIAAKSMYNMALVCEMNGEFEAAMDWATKSFQKLGNEYTIHAYNCKEYIDVIAQRKLDIKKIEN